MRLLSLPHPNILIDREVTHDDASVCRIIAAVTHTCSTKTDKRYFVC
jgi:hypothetical protein